MCTSSLGKINKTPDICRKKGIQDTQLVASGDDDDMHVVFLSLIFYYSQVETLLAVKL
jgi:hypothetical protein